MIKNNKQKSHENLTNMLKTKKFVAFFQANSGLENQGRKLSCAHLSDLHGWVWLEKLMSNRNVFKLNSFYSLDMLPSDPSGSLDESFFLGGFYHE